MRKMFVPTENFTLLKTAVDAVERRGAQEAGMMVVYGEVGRGKSFIVEHWASKTEAVFLRANVDWTPRYFLIELAKALGVDTNGAKDGTITNSQQLFERILGKVIETQCTIIIDEAEYTLRNNAAVAEKLRDISDRAENMIVFVGMQRILHLISRFKQLERRIARVVKFKAISEADVAHICNKLAEVVIQPDLQAEIFKRAKGRTSEVLNIIATVETSAKLNGLDSICLADMQGVTLSYDWASLKNTKAAA